MVYVFDTVLLGREGCLLEDLRLGNFHRYTPTFKTGRLGTYVRTYVVHTFDYKYVRSAGAPKLVL